MNTFRGSYETPSRVMRSDHVIGAYCTPLPYPAPQLHQWPLAAIQPPMQPHQHKLVNNLQDLQSRYNILRHEEWKRQERQRLNNEIWHLQATGQHWAHKQDELTANKGTSYSSKDIDTLYKSFLCDISDHLKQSCWEIGWLTGMNEWKENIKDRALGSTIDMRPPSNTVVQDCQTLLELFMNQRRFLDQMCHSPIQENNRDFVLQFLAEWTKNFEKLLQKSHIFAKPLFPLNVSQRFDCAELASGHCRAAKIKVPTSNPFFTILSGQTIHFNVVVGIPAISQSLLNKNGIFGLSPHQQTQCTAKIICEKDAIALMKGNLCGSTIKPIANFARFGDAGPRDGKRKRGKDEHAQNDSDLLASSIDINDQGLQATFNDTVQVSLVWPRKSREFAKITGGTSCETKFYILIDWIFQMEFGPLHVYDVSLPFMYGTNQGSQSSRQISKMFWTLASAPQVNMSDQSPVVGEKSMKVETLIEKLCWFFSMMTGADSLTDAAKDHISLRLLDQANSCGVPKNDEVTEDMFRVNMMHFYGESGSRLLDFKFWDWFYSYIELMQRMDKNEAGLLNEYLTKGVIWMFISKKYAEQYLRAYGRPAFIIRTSDNKPGSVTISALVRHYDETDMKFESVQPMEWNTNVASIVHAGAQLYDIQDICIIDGSSCRFMNVKDVLKYSPGQQNLDGYYTLWTGWGKMRRMKPAAVQLQTRPVSLQDQIRQAVSRDPGLAIQFKSDIDAALASLSLHDQQPHYINARVQEHIGPAGFGSSLGAVDRQNHQRAAADSTGSEESIDSDHQYSVTLQDRAFDTHSELHTPHTIAPLYSNTYNNNDQPLYDPVYDRRSTLN